MCDSQQHGLSVTWGTCQKMQIPGSHFYLSNCKFLGVVLRNLYKYKFENHFLKNEFPKYPITSTTGIFWFVLHFTVPYRYFVFYKLKICGNAVLNTSISTIFLTVCAHFMSLCQILVILTIFQTFSLILYLLWWCVISDLWGFRYNCFQIPQTAPV